MGETDLLRRELIACNHLGACRWQLVCHVDRPIKLNNNKQKDEITMGHLKGAGSNKAQCGNQGSPQPGSPRSQRAPSRHDITPWHFEANTDNAGSQQSGEKLPPWNRRVKRDLRWKRRRGNRPQVPSKSAQYCFSNHHIAPVLWVAPLCECSCNAASWYGRLYP